MTAFRSWRLWPVLALIAMLCMAVTPATAWACACHMGAANSLEGAHRIVGAKVVAGKAELPKFVLQSAHSCCPEMSAEATSERTLAPSPGFQKASVISSGELKSQPAHASCCCGGNDQNALVGAKLAWSGWGFAPLAIVPPAAFVFEAQPQASAFYHPVAQSPPESPPFFTGSGRAPPVLAS